MGVFSIWHWLIVIFIFVIVNLPAFWVFRKAGWSGWMFLVLAIPLVNIIVIYVFAFMTWPFEKAEPAVES